MKGLITLLSEKDHEIVIKSLEHYANTYDLEQSEKFQVNILLNWVKLQLAKAKIDSTN